LTSSQNLAPHLAKVLVTLLLSKLVGENGQVHAFEPNPQLQQTLEKTFRHNQISNVCLHPVALGSEASQMTLRVPQGNAGAASLIRSAKRNNCDVFEVPIKTLSQVVAQEKIKSIRLIKIDVEGFEAEVFKGGQDILEFIRPGAILFELNEKSNQPVSERPVIKILHEAGYGFFSIPKCIFRMRLERFEASQSSQLVGHDLLAVTRGECYERTARIVNASARTQNLSSN
jgi:FkbM family methyltransferase